MIFISFATAFNLHATAIANQFVLLSFFASIEHLTGELHQLKTVTNPNHENKVSHTPHTHSFDS